MPGARRVLPVYTQPLAFYRFSSTGGCVEIGPANRAATAREREKCQGLGSQRPCSGFRLVHASYSGVFTPHGFRVQNGAVGLRRERVCASFRFLTVAALFRAIAALFTVARGPDGFPSRRRLDYRAPGLRARRGGLWRGCLFWRAGGPRGPGSRRPSHRSTGPRGG